MSDWFYNNKVNAQNAFDLMLKKKRNDWNSFDSSAFDNYIGKCTRENLNNPLDTIKSNTTLLHTAVALDNEYAVKTLLSYGVSTNTVDTFENTPLDLAIKNNNKRIVEMLTDNTNTKAKDDEIASLKEHAVHYRNDLTKHKDSYEAECKKRKRCEDELLNAKTSYRTSQTNENAVKRSLVVAQDTNYVLKNNNSILSNENASLKKKKLSLENDNMLLKADNSTLINENRLITKERNTFKNRYETLKESTKK